MKKTVQYMRPYSADELAQIGARLEQVFSELPSLVAMAVLAMELKMLLSDVHAEGTDVVIDQPHEVTELAAALEAAAPALVVLCVTGLTRQETVS